MNTLIIDNGSGYQKVGFAGDAFPKIVAPSIVGRPKHVRVMTSSSMHYNKYVGTDAHEMRGMLRLSHPIEHGMVTDWEDMQAIWSSIYSSLGVASEDHPVLFTEPPLNPRKNRDELAQILFETFNIPSLYISMQAVLSLYSTGRTTGMVLDSGDGVTHAVPIVDGFSIPNAVKRTDIAGRDVTERLRMLLRKSGTIMTTSSEFEIVREIKEKLAYISPDPVKEAKAWGLGHDKPAEYRLPDGKVIVLEQERFLAPEVLFDPGVIGSEEMGAHKLLADSISRVDLDLRSQLYENIVLSGGSTLTAGFGERMLNEVRQISAKGMKIKIFAPPERQYSTWIGGSILGNLSTFRKMLVTHDEYIENPGIIHVKCL